MACPPLHEGEAAMDHNQNNGAEIQDPVQPPSPTESEAELPASAEVPQPTNSKLGRSIGIAVAALVVVAVLGTAGFRAVQRGSEARGTATEAIVAAEKALQDAQLAVEPGSQELTENQQAQAALSEAKRLRDAGFLVLASRYREAEQKAASARKTATKITDRVEALADQAAEFADSGQSDPAVDLYFKLHDRYPRTAAGRNAIELAGEVLASNLPSGDYDSLIKIKAFCKECPEKVPAAVYTAADKRLKSAADSSLSWQRMIVANNKSWAKKLRSGKRTTFGIQGTSKSETTELSRMIATLSAVKGTEYKKALVLLRDCSKLGQTCDKISRSPVRKTSTTWYFSSSQISRIAKLSSQMDAKLKKANALLKKV